jgi:hypothetical protein
MLRLSTTLLAATTGLAVLVPSQAYAGSYVRPDATGDVSSQTDDGPYVRTPSRVEGDVRTSGVSYAGRRVTVAIGFAQLTQTTEITGHLLRLRTNKGKVRDVTVIAGPGQWAGRTQLTKGNGNRVRCALGHRIDYVADRVTVSIPRKCLGKPRWVRVGIGVVSVQDEVFFADDAATNGVLRANPILGPIVRRG